MIGAENRARVEARVVVLRDEMARGTRRLEEIEGEAARLRETLLRIAGAIQVLGELLEPGGEQDSAADRAP